MADAPSFSVWRPEHLTPEWLTAALGAAVSQRVVSIDIEPVGTGQMADSFRLHLHYGAGDWGPATIVGKFTAADE
ncbi:MAG: aminoglycoside phosphotransferase, partial [Acidimicrobiales bacterium]